MSILLECVRTVKTPDLPIPGDDDAYEPSAEDLAWLAGRDHLAPRCPAMSAEWLAAWGLAEHVDQDLPFDAWLDAIADQHEALIASTAGRRYAWLARRLRDLAAAARFLGAADPDTFDERDEAISRRS